MTNNSPVAGCWVS